MRFARIGPLVLVLAVCSISSKSLAGDCTGNGCDYIEIRKRGGCIVIANTHNKPIKVRPKNVVNVSSGTVYANSEHIPKHMDGSCVTSYNFDYSAVLTGIQTNEACKKVRSIKDLGWGEGHKTRFCRSKGYAGVTNFRGSAYRDYGGGFCYTGNKKACLDLVRGHPK